MMRAVVTGTGHRVPDLVLTNDELVAKYNLDSSDEWIVQRTGIRERRICSDDEAASDLAIAAAKEALQSAGCDPMTLDMVIVATVCGDYTFPSTACVVQDAIGAKNAGAFDLGAACAGFIYSSSVADGFVRSGQCKKVLVVGVDVLSKYVDWSDRSTCVLFGDGAAAVLYEAIEDNDRGIQHTVLYSDGSGGRHICLDVGGSRYRTKNHAPNGLHEYIFMNGPETYRFAVHSMGDACCKVLEEAGLTSADVDLFVPHQANKRIIDASAERMGLDSSHVFLNVQKYGNTSAASIPLALYEAAKVGKLKRGDLALTVGFGAGLVWGANLIRW